LRPVKFDFHETEEVIISQAGLSAVGGLLATTDLYERVNKVRFLSRHKPKISNGDILYTMLGLLCLGKPDFEAAREFLDDPFFQMSLGIKKMPSVERLRQRLDDLAGKCENIIDVENSAMLARFKDLISADHGFIPLDIDVSIFDNSDSKKEGVAYTYKQLNGYAPIFAYLGLEGFLIACELREGSVHCQKGTVDFIRRTIENARKVTGRRLLLRMDSGNDAIENIHACNESGADWLIKRNLRGEAIDEWETEALKNASEHEEIDGVDVYRGATIRERDGIKLRAVYEVRKKKVEKNGQLFLCEGETEVDTYWTSLELAPSEVIELYRRHATSEQFHSELKTDMDLERLPSGKFATNDLILRLGMMAYNVLRLIGQAGLNENRKLKKDQSAPLPKKVKRRRVGSVIRDFLYVAARFVRHARRWGLSFWRKNPWHILLGRIYEYFMPPPLTAK